MDLQHLRALYSIIEASVKEKKKQYFKCEKLISSSLMLLTCQQTEFPVKCSNLSLFTLILTYLRHIVSIKFKLSYFSLNSKMLWYKHFIFLPSIVMFLFSLG